MAHDDLETLGQRLKFLRGLSGLSARQLDSLARRGAESSAYTSLVEAGKRSNINADLASRYAAVLGCSLEWLISGTGHAPTPLAVKRAAGRAVKKAA